MSRRALAALAAAAVLALTACGSSGDDGGGDSGASQAPDAQDAGTREVETDYGTVSVPADPQRVVLLNFALAGYLYDLDAPVVATIPEVADMSEGVYSEFWAEEAEAAGTEFLPWSVDGFDLESIMEMEPDLIVGGGIGFPLFQAEQVYDDLSSIAPTVLVSGELDTWQQQLEFLAVDVFGRQEVYDDAVAAYEARVLEVADAIDPPEGEVAYLAMTGDGTAYVLIEDMGLPAELARTGLTPAPLFAEGGFEPYTAGGDMFELSTEQVGQVITQETVLVMGFNGETLSVADLNENPVYAALPAFTAGQAYDLPYWVIRSDFDEAMATLDLVEELF